MMNRFQSIYWFLILSGSGGTLGYCDELAELTTAYQASQELVLDEFERSRAKLAEQFTSALKQRETAFQEKGDLESLLRIRKFRESFESSGSVQEFPSETQNLVDAYHRALKPIVAKRDDSLGMGTAAYVVKLDELTTALTKADDLEGALKARNVRNAVQKGELPIQGQDSINGHTPAEEGNTGAASATTDNALQPVELLASAGDGAWKGLADIPKLLPFDFELKKGGKLDVEKMERLNLSLQAQRNQMVNWFFTYQQSGDTSMYGSTEFLAASEETVEIGKHRFAARVRVFPDDDGALMKMRKGSTFAIEGRLAFCLLSANGGGTLRIDIGNARLKSRSDGSVIPPLPEVVIGRAWFASGGSGFDIREMLQDRLVYRNGSLKIDPASIGRDPAPGWAKNLSLSYSIGEKKVSLGRAEGALLSIEDLYRNFAEAQR